MDTSHRGFAKRVSAMRRGILQVEIVVAAGLILAAISLVYSINHRLQLIDKETRNYQFALHEIANCLEVATTLEPDAMEKYLQDLKPSEELVMRFEGAKLESKVVEDDAGRRLELSFTCKSWADRKPLVLVGCLVGSRLAKEEKTSFNTPTQEIEDIPSNSFLSISDRESL
jgi:hypothetical protein